MQTIKSILILLALLLLESTSASAAEPSHPLAFGVTASSEVPGIPGVKQYAAGASYSLTSKAAVGVSYTGMAGAFGNISTTYIAASFAF